MILRNLGNKNSGRALAIVLGLLAVIVLVVIICFSWAVGINNNLVRLNQAADSQWATVQAQYQRRLDLIPNLVATVNGVSEQEKAVVLGATQARANATKININASDPAAFKQFQESQAQLSGALSRLLVTVEKYPEIRTNENFRDLQSQLEGTENRIAVERKKYNEAVQAYNNAALVFPGSLIAAFRNFKQRPYFTADEEAQHAPKVDFSNAPAAPSASFTPAASGTAPTNASQVPPPPSTAPTSPTKALPPEGFLLLKNRTAVAV
jgi:LemA protein